MDISMIALEILLNKGSMRHWDFFPNDQLLGLSLNLGLAKMKQDEDEQYYKDACKLVDAELDKRQEKNEL